MESSKSDVVTRGHEHYLSHILLLEQVSPIALKAIIKREQIKCGKDLGILLKKERHTIQTQFETEYLQLFQKDDVNDNIDTWDALQLCAVALALFKSDLTSPAIEAIKCIYDQRKDIEKNVECASLRYNTYKETHRLLQYHLLDLIMLIDHQANLDCKRMMFSFEPQSINLDKSLIEKLKHTKDVKTLVIALKAHVVIRNDIPGEENDHKRHSICQSFTEELHSKNVYVNDSAVLRCKLNNPVGDNIEWRKDYKPVEITDNIVTMNKHCTHWLAITHASLADTGKYSCKCGNISTSAYLTVIDEAVNVVVDLPVKIEVTENGNIDIECKVNLLTSKAVWRHKGKCLESSDRYVILAKGTTHTLTVMNVTFRDEGEYTVDFGKASSKTTLVVQGDTDILHRKQLNENLYRNWVRGTLALKYLKVGLEEFCNKAVKRQHDHIVSAHGGEFYDRIVCSHRYKKPLLANTDVQKWSSDPWSVATCFINTPGYKGKQSAKDVDCSGLLSLCINNCYIEKEMLLGQVFIDGRNDAFTQARKVRNNIFHSPNYELTKHQLNAYVKTFKEVLEIKAKNGNTPLKDEQGVVEALQLLDMVQTTQIEINLEHEIMQMREHGMYEFEEKYQNAKKEHELKLQLIEQQIKDKENELRLMLNLRSAGKQKNLEEQFLLDLQIRVIAQNSQSSAEGNQRVYEVMSNYINEIDNDDMTGSPFNVRATDTPVYRLLDYIKVTKKCRIIGISHTDQSSTDIQINCLSSDAMKYFLKSVNGNEFQQELFQLRRWLYVQKMVEPHDIIANCSSIGIGKANQRLHFTDVTRSMTCAEHQNTQCTLYCPDHDWFLCTACRESRHGSTCHGIKQVTSERSYDEQKHRLAIKSTKGSYNFSIDNTLINRNNNDKTICFITSMCMLPNGEVLLADFANNRLKKLNSSYKVISQFDVNKDHISVCYIGNDTAVANSGGDNTIQYLNVSGNIKQRQSVNLHHDCLGLACHGDTLYVNSGDTIYKYDKNCTQKQVLYHYPRTVYSLSIAISDNGERLYLSSHRDITTIDAKGNHIFSLQIDDYNICDICIAGEGIVLVLDVKNNVHQLDYNGKKHRTVDNMSLNISFSRSMCFDRERCRLIVGGGEDKIFVYKCEFIPS